jgi:hypothetical protein
MHGSRQGLDDNEQHIQPLKEEKSGQRTWYAEAEHQERLARHATYI